MNEVLLSTSDNPWNPWTNFDEWYVWDSDHGYNTPGYLARMAPTSSELPDETNNMLIWEAIGEIVAHDLLGLVTDDEVHYIAVTK